MVMAMVMAMVVSMMRPMMSVMVMVSGVEIWRIDYGDRSIGVWIISSWVRRVDSDDGLAIEPNLSRITSRGDDDILLMMSRASGSVINAHGLLLMRIAVHYSRLEITKI